MQNDSWADLNDLYFIQRVLAQAISFWGIAMIADA